MTTYRRRQTDTIEATQFTSELGGIVRGVTAGTYPDGLEHSEHSGYSFHGQRICFGDYLVGSMLVEKAAFEKQWELATLEAIAPAYREPVRLPTPDEERAAVFAGASRAFPLGTTGSVAVDTVLKQKLGATTAPDATVGVSLTVGDTSVRSDADGALVIKQKPRGKRTEPGA